MKFRNAFASSTDCHPIRSIIFCSNRFWWVLQQLQPPWRSQPAPYWNPGPSNALETRQAELFGTASFIIPSPFPFWLFRIKTERVKKWNLHSLPHKASKPHHHDEVCQRKIQSQKHLGEERSWLTKESLQERPAFGSISSRLLLVWEVSQIRWPWCYVFVYLTCKAFFSLTLRHDVYPYPLLQKEGRDCKSFLLKPMSAYQPWLL